VIDAIGPWIGAGLYRAEPVAAFFIGNRASAAAEIRVERRKIGVLLVAIASTGIGLPELDQRVRNRAAVFVQNAPIDDDTRADGAFTRLGVIDGQVVVQLAQHGMAEGWAGHFRKRIGKGNRRALRRA